MAKYQKWVQWLDEQQRRKKEEEERIQLEAQRRAMMANTSTTAASAGSLGGLTIHTEIDGLCITRQKTFHLL